MLKNKFVAVLICVIVVLGSIFFGARRTLASEVDRVETMFVDGVDGDGQSILNDLRTRAGLALNLTAVAERYLEADDPLITEVRDTARTLMLTHTPSACYELNTRLDLAVSQLNDALEAESLTEADEKYRSGIMTDFESYAAQIAHDGYNDQVRILNEETLEKIPARWLKIITFVGTAEYYG